MKIRFVVPLIFFVVIVNVAFGQAAGDYRSNTPTGVGNWNVGANWQRFDGVTWITSPPQGVPTSTGAGVITIRAGHTATVNANFTVDQVVVESTGTLTVATGRTLNIAEGPGDDLVNSGTLNISGGTLNINSSAVVINTGILNTNGSFINNGSYNGLLSGITTVSLATVLSGTGVTQIADFMVEDGAEVLIEGTNVNLYGILTLQGVGSLFDADGLSDAGVFRVMSVNEAEGGRIAALPAVGAFTGNVTVQRFIPGVANGDYRYISVPITNGNASMLRAAIGVTGNFSDRSTSAQFPTIVNSGNLNASVYSWNPVGQAYVGLHGGGGTTALTAISNTTGYAAYNFSETNRTIEYRGTIGKGQVIIPISSVDEQFSIMPNPYPSPLDWFAVYEANQTVVSSSMYMRTASFAFDTFTAEIGTPPGTPEYAQIATGQSVWVQSTGNGSNVVLEEAHKSGNGYFGIFVRKAEPINYFRIKLASATQADYAVIRFHGDATDEKDNKFDAVKRRNGNYVSALGQYSYLNLSSYTTAAAKDFAINSVDELTECSKVMGLKITDVKPGAHSFQFTSLEKLELGYKITLIDHFTNTEKVVSDNFEYAFNVTAAPASFGEARFQLRIENAATRTITVEGQTLVSNVSSGNQWYKDGQPIQGATSATLDVTASGTYTVKTTIGGCEGTADNVVMSITALPEETNGIATVYPNPTSGKIIINLPADKDALLTGISLYDSKGSLITDSHKDASLNKPGEKSIDISTSKNGIYILNLISGQHVKSVRLIKK